MPLNDRPRINLSPDPDLLKDLEEWAEQQKRPVASMALYLLSRTVEEAKKSGEFTPSSQNQSGQNQSSEDLEQMGEYVKLLMGLRPRNGLSFAEIADITGLPSRKVEELYQLVEQCRKQHETQS